ncbi:hypothetical protein AKO1_007940 [Acrasis kona]|uniref:Uncharacterized protein n=1 Tax=Acrasis kona TaxID=1008807 RepID=A0AAW2YQ66_9EUKA
MVGQGTYTNQDASATVSHRARRNAARMILNGILKFSKYIVYLASAVTTLYLVFLQLDNRGIIAKTLLLECPAPRSRISVSYGTMNTLATTEVTLESENNNFHFNDEEFPFRLTVKNNHPTRLLPKGTSFRIKPTKNSDTFRGQLIHELESDVYPEKSITASVKIKQYPRPPGINYIKNFPDTFSLMMQMRDNEGKYRDTPITYDTFAFNTTMFKGEVLRSMKCNLPKDIYKKKILLFGPNGSHKSTIFCLLKNVLQYGPCGEQVRRSRDHVTTSLTTANYQMGDGYTLQITDNVGNTFMSNKFCSRILQGTISEGNNLTKKGVRHKLLEETSSFETDFKRNPQLFSDHFPRVMLYVMTMASLADPEKIKKMDYLFELAKTLNVAPVLVITDMKNATSDLRLFSNWRNEHTGYKYFKVITPENVNSRSTIRFVEGKVWMHVLSSSLMDYCLHGSKATIRNRDRSDFYDAGCVQNILKEKDYSSLRLALDLLYNCLYFMRNIAINCGFVI